MVTLTKPRKQCKEMVTLTKPRKQCKEMVTLTKPRKQCKEMVTLTKPRKQCKEMVTLTKPRKQCKEMVTLTKPRKQCKEMLLTKGHLLGDCRTISDLALSRLLADLLVREGDLFGGRGGLRNGGRTWNDVSQSCQLG